MNILHTPLATRIGLALVMAAGIAGAAQAADLNAQDTMRIRAGDSQAQVQAQFGEPVKVATYLFAPGSTWYYHVGDDSIGSERVIEVRFDGQGQVQSARLHDAYSVGLNQFDAS